MATAHKDRTIAAAPQQVWEVVADPWRLPQWWPGVKRMEAVEDDRWTEVHMTKRGRPVRIDFHLLYSEPPYRRAWEQEIPGTPFERVLNEAITEIQLDLVGSGTRITIGQRQKLRGYSRTGGYLLRRATVKKLAEALDGLEEICAGA
jgi:uncharacterized protein YndB with AHSA1/START domain